MSVILELQRQINALQRDVERVRTVDKPAAFLPFSDFTTQGTTTNTYIALCSVLRVYTYIRWTQVILVATTNDGSNYWTVTLDDGGTTIKSFNTSAISPNVFAGFEYDYSTLTQPASTPPNGFVGVQIAKTGSPGGFYWAAPAVQTITS
jgi:hypothetical protein